MPVLNLSSTPLEPRSKPDTIAIKSSIASCFVALLGALIGTVLLVGARDIAPPMFDPVGSAALPIACAVTLMLLGIGVLLQSLLQNARLQTADDGKSGTTRVASLGLLALMIVYLLAMHLGIRFSLATTGFVALAIPLICQRLRVLPLALFIAIILGFGSEWLFTSIFFVDLPGTR